MTRPSPTISHLRQLLHEFVRRSVASEGEPAALGKSATAGSDVFYNDGTTIHEDRVWVRTGANLQVLTVALVPDGVSIPEVANTPVKIAYRYGMPYVVAVEPGGEHLHDFDTRVVSTSETAGRVGQDNTIMGNLAGANMTTGALHNTVIGSFAAGELTTADQNTYIGSNAGPTSGAGTGLSNAGVGYSALWALSSGARNVGVGDTTGDGVTTGNDNVFVGYNVGGPSGGQDESTIVGSESFKNNGSDGNTGLGYRAGNGSSGTYNVCIGHRAGITQASGSELYIDANPTTPSTPLIFGEFDTRNIGLINRGRGSSSFGTAGASGVIAIGNAITIPTTNPTNGIILYVDPADGLLKYRDAAGGTHTWS